MYHVDENGNKQNVRKDEEEWKKHTRENYVVENYSDKKVGGLQWWVWLLIAVGVVLVVVIAVMAMKKKGGGGMSSSMSPANQQFQFRFF